MTRVPFTISLDYDEFALVQKARELSLKEGKSFNISEIIRAPIKQALTQWIYEHGAGNPTSTMDDYIKNPNFWVCPMVNADFLSINKFLQTIRNTPKWKELGYQLENGWIQQYLTLDKEIAL